MYYKHKLLEAYAMITPNKVVKVFGGTISQYTTRDFCFGKESTLNMDFYQEASRDEFRIALEQTMETISQTLKNLEP